MPASAPIQRISHRRHSAYFHKVTKPISSSERAPIEPNRTDKTLTTNPQSLCFCICTEGFQERSHLILVYVQYLFDVHCSFPSQWFVLIRSHERKVLGIISSDEPLSKSFKEMDVSTLPSAIELRIPCCAMLWHKFHEFLQTQRCHGGVSLLHVYGGG